MSHDPKDLTQIDEPLSVEEVEGKVVVDGVLPVPVALTRDAALETGVDLVKTALKLPPEPDRKK